MTQDYTKSTTQELGAIRNQLEADLAKVKEELQKRQREINEALGDKPSYLPNKRNFYGRGIEQHCDITQNN